MYLDARKPERWEETWIKMTHLIASRSKDSSFSAGAVLVGHDNKTVLGTGYNGPSPYISDAFAHSNRDLRHALTNHAESNCLWFAVAAHGRDALRGGRLYVNGRPCAACAKECARAGLGRVIWDDTNSQQPKMVDAAEWAKTTDILQRAGVELVPYSTLKGDR